MTDGFLRIVTTRHGLVEMHPWGALVRMQAGDPVPAMPHDTPDYRAITLRCGYGADRLAYCQEHEVAHLVVCEWLYDEPSAVLLGLAMGRPLTARQAAMEEYLAQGLQRWVRTGERPITAGLHGMHTRFLEVIGG